MSIAYTLFFTEPPSRNLEERVNPEETELRRLEDLHKIDYLMQSMIEDLQDLLPAGYTVQFAKEKP